MQSNMLGWAKRIERWLGVFAVAMLLAACGGSPSSPGAGEEEDNGRTPPAPTAQIESIAPATPAAGQSVRFAGSGSGHNIQYAWDFGDGATAQGAEAAHAYATGGTFAVTLRVTDGNGQQAIATSQVVVENVVVPPSAPKIQVDPGQAEVGIAKGMQAVSIDPNGGPLTYTWNFGDGAIATGQSVTHTYAVEGTFTISVVATNQAGASATATADITVTALPDVVGPPSTPSIFAPPLVRMKTLAQFSGTSESADGSPLNYVWSFSGDTFSPRGPVVEHTFLTTSGISVATLTVTDVHGNSAAASATVTVLPPEPPHSVVVHGPQEAIVGEAVNFSASVENPEDNPLTYQWDFGDGATSTDVAPSHTYTAEGQHTVSVTITDPLTGSTAGSMTLLVTDTSPTDDLKCAGLPVGTGWCIAPPLPIGGMTALNDVSFANARSGWIVGQNGSVVHTTDGGFTWTLQLTGPAGQIGVSAVDNNHAWVLNHNGQVLRTTDAGDTWSTTTTGAPFGLTAIRFVDQSHGWAVGQGEGIISTSDGGATWTVRNRNTSKPALNRLDFVDVNHGWAVSAGGYVLRTNNGGQSWDTVFQAASGIALNGVSFSDTQHGWVAGSAGTLMKTTDGGATWITGNAPTTEWIRAVKFVSPSVGWIVTETGFIFHTDNAGNSWTAQNTPAQTTGVPAIDSVNANNAWIVSAGGSYLVTITGGN